MRNFTFVCRPNRQTKNLFRDHLFFCWHKSSFSYKYYLIKRLVICISHIFSIHLCGFLLFQVHGAFTNPNNEHRKTVFCEWKNWQFFIVPLDLKCVSIFLYIMLIKSRSLENTARERRQKLSFLECEREFWYIGLGWIFLKSLLSFSVWFIEVFFYCEFYGKVSDEFGWGTLVY